MKTIINVDIGIARNALYISAGSYEESEIILKMSEEEVINTVLRHCKCWGIQKAGED